MNPNARPEEASTARPLRLEANGALYHVIARGNERKPIFRDDRDRRDYLERLDHYRSRMKFALLAYCLMENHVHFAIRRGPIALSRIMHALQSSYTQRFNRRHDRVGHLFQGRYKAFLVEESRYAVALVRYIHRNPVEAKLCANPEDYLWSSARYIGRTETALFDLDECLSLFATTRTTALREYKRILGEPSSSEVFEPKSPWISDPEFALVTLVEAGEGQVLRGFEPEQLLREVANLQRWSVAAVISGRRNGMAARRSLVAWLCREEAGVPVARTAAVVGRDESTLARQVRNLEARLREDPRFRDETEELASRLRLHMRGLARRLGTRRGRNT